MFFSSFHRQKLSQYHKTYESFRDIFRHSGYKKYVGFFLFLFILLTSFFLLPLPQVLGNIGSFFFNKTIKLVSTVGGVPMQQDSGGSINVLIIGYGGESHTWGNYLADSIIVASFHPKHNTVTLISIPRDLYVYEKGKYANKINAIFDKAYRESQKMERIKNQNNEMQKLLSTSNEGIQADDDLDFPGKKNVENEETGHRKNIAYAAKELSRKVGDILGLSIPYYVAIDFAGFVKVIDTLGGIDIYVPETLHDTQYPDPTVGHYVTFHVDAGMQHMDGATALKYARSRHSSSDFSRSKRQQAIIQAIVEKILSTKTLTNPSTLQSLYEQYKDMVVTNISFKEILGMAKYGLTRPTIHPFVLSICQNVHYSVVTPGCVLQQKLYARAYLLPAGAEPEYPFYDVTKFFAFLTVHNPGYLRERAKIAVYNAIDPEVAKAYPYRQGLAGSVGARLKRYGFNLIDVDNAKIPIEKTTLVILDPKSVSETMKVLPLFLDVPFATKTKAEQLAGIAARGQTPAELGVINPADFVTGADTSRLPDIEIYLGNDVLEVYGKGPFPLYKK